MGEINGATYFARVHSIRDEILPADRILVNDCDGKVDTECRTFAFTWAFGVSVSTVKFNKMFENRWGMTELDSNGSLSQVAIERLIA